MSKQQWLNLANEQKYLAKLSLAELDKIISGQKAKSESGESALGDAPAIALFAGTISLISLSALSLCKETAVANLSAGQSVDAVKAGSLAELVAKVQQSTAQESGSLWRLLSLVNDDQSWLGQLVNAERVLNSVNQSIAKGLAQKFPSIEPAEANIIGRSTTHDRSMPEQMVCLLQDILRGLDDEITQVRELGWEG